MATNTKNKEWAKANKDMLMDMLDKGYIALKDLQAINNKDEKFTIEQQDAAFDRVKKDIQSRYSEDRLNSDDAKSVLSEDRIKQFRTFRESVDKFDKPTDALLSSKLSEQIKSSGYKDLPLLKGMAEQIKNMSDVDVKEYIYNQRQYLNQMLPGKAIESIPDLQEYMTIPPNYGVKNTDYGKMFNDPDILDKLNELSYRDIDYVARKNGMNGKELLKDLTDAKIAKDREDIAHGRWRKDATATIPIINEEISGLPANLINKIGGIALSIFGPRQQEAIARGEEPDKYDIVGDAAEQLAYMAPVGRIAGPAAKFGAKISPVASKAFSTIASIGSNTIVPTASEIYDSIVYDDANNPRSEFSAVDDAFGTGVNIAGPLGIKMLGNRVGRILDSRTITKKWGELAEGKSANQVIDEAEAVRNRIGKNQSRITQPGTVGDLTPDYYKEAASAGELTTPKENRLMKLLAKEQGVTTPNQQALNAAIKDPYILNNDNITIYKKSGKGKYNPELSNVDKYSPAEWTTLVKAMKNKEKTYLWHGERKQVPDMKDIKAALNPEFVKNYQNSPYATSMFLKSNKELLEEDAIKNYLTNQFGNATYGDENVSLPIAAPMNYFGININQELKNYRANKERQKAKEESMRRLPTLESLYGNLK